MGTKVRLCTKALGDYIAGTSDTELLLESKHFLYLSASQNSQEISSNDSLLKNVRFLLNPQEPSFLGNWQ